jgi:hypothetical protein
MLWNPSQWSEFSELEKSNREFAVNTKVLLLAEEWQPEHETVQMHECIRI